jgi:hypothetical protein
MDFEKIRIKMRCVWHGEQLGYPDRVLHQVKFSVVTSSSQENEKFFAATPSGTIEFSTLKDMPFVVGAEYYFDILAAG